MTPKQFRKYLDRDGGCVHCGEQEAVAPHHRLNRGMGGSKKLDTPENIIVLCSTLNGLLESDAEWAGIGREFGWKLRAGDNPAETPVFLPLVGFWVLLTTDYDAKKLTKEQNADYQTGIYF